MAIGIIGGSGLYQLSESGTPDAITVDTPFGEPSGRFYKQTVGPNEVYFLARHGEGHRVSPSEINFRANIYGFKKLGVNTLISVSAVGSMKEELAPGQFVLPEQYIDNTKGVRPNTFFGNGVVAHAHFADPECQTLRTTLSAAAKAAGITCHTGGTYVCIEGPQFSTRAESHLYRSWGVDVIGMTALPEARLAREAGLCYQTVAMVTDYDCWKEGDEDVSVDAILAVLKQNVETSRKLVVNLLSKTLPSCEVGCAKAMETSVITPQEKWPESRREELKLILS